MTDPRPVLSPLLSLRGRLLFLICLATLPAVLFIFFAAASQRAAMLTLMEREAILLARVTSHEHAHQIQGARNLLTWMGATASPTGQLPESVTDARFLRALLAGHPQLANIGVLSAEGKVVASAYALPDYPSWRDHPAFVAAAGSSVVVAGTYAISPIFNRPTLNHAYAVRNAQGAVTAVLFNGLDLEWLAELVRQSELPVAFSLACRLHEARELEAARISRELHDEIGQLLTSLKIELSCLTSRCTAGPHGAECAEQLQAGIDPAKERIDGALDFVRRISAQLRPGVLDKLGLVAALEGQAREIEARSELVVQVEADPVDPHLPEIVAVTLFRIAQEALTNVLRHARAHMVEVHLRKTAAAYVLEIRDDGVGMATDVVERGDALGIIGMRERAVLVSGQLSISTVPGHGTTVRVCVPRSARKEGDDAHPAGG